jgi:alpha/beta superfamily hydrolase
MMLEIAGPAGSLEALLDKPASGEAPRAAMVFAHPLPTGGGTMHTKVVYHTAKALSRIGCAVLRFNFRGAGRSEGVFDDGRGELDDYRAALDFMAAQFPGVQLWGGGFSFGAYVGLTVGIEDERVRLLLGIAPPLSRYDFTGVAHSAKPKFFIQGERDEICPIQKMWEFYGQCEEPKELVVIDAADHLFDGKVSEVAEAVEDLLGDFPSGPED